MVISKLSKTNTVLACVLALLIATLPSAANQKASAATPSAPAITAIGRVAGGLTVNFTAPSGASPAITNYEYSVDGGSSWVSPLTPITGSPFTITDLVECQSYLVTVRAVNEDGPGAAAVAWNGVPGSLTYNLNNGQMKYGALDTAGNGEVESILPSGNLKQPWYKNSAGAWRKLTFSSQPLNYGLGANGDGSAEWNTNGTFQEVSGNLTNMTIDCSQFVETSRVGNLAVGYGKLTVTGRVTIGGKLIEVTRSYSQTATSKYTIFNESIKNVGTETLTNARVVIGSRDDWLETDSPTKKRGNIVDGVFSQIPTAATQAKVLEITSASDAVYFYTTSNLGYVTGLNGYGNFRTEVMGQNPATAQISRTNDGSYGMYLRFQDIAPGASESFTWYYIASTKATAAELLGNVASAALPGAPTVNAVTAGDAQASIDFTEGAIGGAALTNYQYSIDGGLTWQTRSPAGTTSPISISGLANGTEYEVQLRAINSEGVGTATTSTAVTPVGPPPAPFISGVEQAETSVDIAFTQQATGGLSITNYEYSLDGGVTWITPSPEVTTSPLTISGLTRGTEYDFAIRAINSAGAGVSSAIQEARTLDLPEAPSIGAASISNQAISVPFTLGENGGSPISNIEYSLDGGATWDTRSPSSTYSPLLIQNLVNGENYQVSVRAVNTVGHSTSSSIISATPATVPSAIALPLSTNVTPQNQSLVVDFTTPNSGGSAITRYEYSTDRGSTWRERTDSGSLANSLEITTLSSDGTTVLSNGTEYCIQVRAVNAVGVGLASNDVCSTPKSVPNAPTFTSITSRDRGLDVSFTLGSNGGSSITDVEYCLEDCGSNSSWVSVGSVSSPFRISGLINGTTYTVSLRTINALGPSLEESALASVAPANNPSAPTNLVVITASRSATVTFNVPSSDGGVPISNYEYSTDGGITWLARTDGETTSTTLEISKLSSDGTTLLTNGLSYEIAVRAVTASTVGLSSSIAFATPSTTPSAPTNEVVVVYNGRFVVSFDPSSDGGSPITNYEYALSTNNGSSWGNFIPANVLTPGFTITNLDNGTPYRIKVRALNSRGEGAELVSASEFTPVGVPDSPIISATSNSRLTPSLTDRQIQVSFTEPANNGSPITNYQYSTDNGVTWQDRTDVTGRFSPLVISKLSSDVTADLDVDTAYQIKIRAKNVNGDGDESLMTSSRTGGAIDLVAPTVTITSTVGSESPSRTLSYSVEFSETIQGLERSDFVKASGTATCSVSSVSGNLGSSFTVTVVCSTDGTYRLRLNANTVTDGSNLGPVTNQDAATVTIDTLAPSATVTTPGSTSGSRTLSYVVAFTSSVTGIGTSDFYQVSGSASCNTTAASAASGNSVTFTVTCTSDGTVVMGLRPDSVVRNGMLGPVNLISATSVTIDTSIPTATVSLESINSAKTILVYEVTFSEPVSDVSLTDFVQAAGSATCRTTAVTASSGTVIKFTVTCTTGGSLQMKLLPNSVTDGTNLAPTSALSTSTQTVGPIVAAGPSNPTTVDTTTPTASIASPGSVSRTRNLSYTVTFSEPVSDISTLDFVKFEGSAQCSTISASQSSGTSVTFRVSCSTDGNVVMQLLALSVTDGTNLGPVAAVLAREVNVRTLPTPSDAPQAASAPQQSTPTPQPSAGVQASPRAPVLLDGELPEIRTSSTITIVSGERVSVLTERLESGGQQMESPTGVKVVIDAKLRSNAVSLLSPSSGLIRVARGDGLQITASGLKPGTEVAVWLFSTPRLLGTAVVDENGNITKVFEIDPDVPFGKHTAQVSGLKATGEIVAFNAGVELILQDSDSSVNGLIENDSTGTFFNQMSNILLIFALGLLAGLWGILLIRKRNKGRHTWKVSVN